MARAILKYELEVKGVQKVKVKKGSRVLSVHVQDGKPYIWIMVNDKAKEEEDSPLEVLVIPTDQPIDAKIDVNKYKFVGTCHSLEGKFVIHVFVR